MNASPPILQIHLLLNVLNRFAFVEGLTAREQAGIECLGDYLVAVHRLQTSSPGSALALLRSTIETLLGLNQWLREADPPSVSVLAADDVEERLSGVVVPLACRVQAALMLLDGQPIREVRIALSWGDGAGSTAIRVRVEVGLVQALASAVGSREGVAWVETAAAGASAAVLVTDFEQGSAALRLAS